MSSFIILCDPHDTDNWWIIGKSCIWVWDDRLIKSELRSGEARPIMALHVRVICGNYAVMRAIVNWEFDFFAARLARRELKNVSYCCSTKAIKRLIFVSNNTKIIRSRWQRKNELLLYVVGVLILVNHYIFYGLLYLVAFSSRVEQIQEKDLLVREVNTVLLNQ